MIVRVKCEIIRLSHSQLTKLALCVFRHASEASLPERWARITMKPNSMLTVMAIDFGSIKTNTGRVLRVPSVEFALLELELLSENVVTIALSVSFVAERLDLFERRPQLIGQCVTALTRGGRKLFKKQTRASYSVSVCKRSRLKLIN